MINFMLPGLYENFICNKFFTEIYFSHPEFFYDNVKIYAVYGNFQFSTWDGGRIFREYTHASVEKIQEIVNFFNEKNIAIRLIFTNKLLKEEHCFDKFNNIVLSICENDLNEVVINSSVLEEYIRKNYPKYKFISSTTKCILNQEELKKEINNNNYHMICLDYNLNHDIKLLNSLTQQEKDKTEFLINAICPPACENRSQHYTLNSQYSLTYGKIYKMSQCDIFNNGLDNPLYKNPTHLSINEIINDYYPKGFKNFKIEGRTFKPLLHLCNLVTYMIKPEYQIYVISLFEKII